MSVAMGFRDTPGVIPPSLMAQFQLQALDALTFRLRRHGDSVRHVAWRVDG